MPDVQPTNTNTTEGGKVTSFMPQANPVVDDDGNKIENPTDALERQRELFKQTEKAEKAEAEKVEKAAEEAAEENKAHPETKMEKLEAPKDTKVAVHKPAKAAGEKEVKN